MASKTLMAYLAKDGSDSRPRMTLIPRRASRQAGVAEMVLVLVPRDPGQPGVGQAVASAPAGLPGGRRFHRRAGRATIRSAGEPAGVWAPCPVRGARGPSTADRSAAPGTPGAPPGTSWSTTVRAGQISTIRC